VAWGVQADASKQLGDSHTLRFGLFFQHDRTRSESINRVFALDALGNQASDTPIVIAVPEQLIGKNLAAYLQDEWKLSDTLTLNAGMRFDHSAAQVSENQLSPRIGLVWTPDDSTVVHLGYARYFTPPPLALIGKGTLSAFDGTTGEVANTTANPIRSERDHLFDIGVQRQLLRHLTVTIDMYYKATTSLLDDTTLGGTLILSPFNYARARNWGIELSASYAQGPFQAYFNMARGQQQAKSIDSNEFLFDTGDLAYIKDHYIYTDHSQKWTLSGGASLNLPDGIGHLQPAMDFIFGSGLRICKSISGSPR
jgi:outer membrane receptor protein involved in Fe transport